MDMQREETVGVARYDTWVHWPVNWTAVWIGSLAALAVGLIIGLAGISLGMHVLGTEGRVVNWSHFKIGTLIFSVFGAFLSFVAGGWVTARIAGIRRSEPAMLHGAIAWLVAVPLLLALGSLGANSFFGGWYGGLGGRPAWAAPTDNKAIGPNATPEEKAQAEENAKVTRNSALGAVTALLLGLVGAVVGGWWASGEPMHPFYYRTRYQTASTTAPPAEMGMGNRVTGQVVR